MSIYETFEEKTRYLQCSKIHTSEELWRFVDYYKKHRNFVFRGVNEAKYMGYSSAQVRTEASLEQNTYAGIIGEAIRLVRNNPLIMDYIRKYSKDDTDFQILALLQHYSCGTPIIDYSTEIESALFFATDRQGKTPQNYPLQDQSIDAYISIYYFDTRDPNHCSVQEFSARDSVRVNESDAEAAKLYGSQYDGISDQTMTSFELLPFNEMVNLNNGGLFTVLGHSNGIIRYRVGGLDVEYDINNERIQAQDGLFIFNGLSKVPYEEAAYNWYSGIKNYCVDIHKSLECEILGYLRRNGITCQTIYPQTEESKAIIEELKKLPMDDRLKPKPVGCPKLCCLKRFICWIRKTFSF